MLTGNITQAKCWTLYPRFNLTNEQRLFLAIFNIMFNGIVSLVLNILVIITITFTKQVKSPGVILVMFLSISDVFGGSARLVLMTILLTTFANRCYWFLELVTMFVLVLG